MTNINTIIEEEKKDYAVIKHIAEIADKHCPDLGVEHQATPAIDIINRFVTTAMQRVSEERDAYWKERVRKEVQRMKYTGMKYAKNGQPLTIRDGQKEVHNLALDTLLDNLK